MRITWSVTILFLSMLVAGCEDFIRNGVVDPIVHNMIDDGLHLEWRSGYMFPS